MTITVSTRKVIISGAQPTSKFAKAVDNLVKKPGPLLALLLNIVAQAISQEAKGPAWLLHFLASYTISINKEGNKISGNT